MARTYKDNYKVKKSRELSSDKKRIPYSRKKYKYDSFSDIQDYKYISI